MNNTVVHELTMLYLKTSSVISPSVPAEEYADLYIQTYKAISVSFQELKGARPVARKAGVINKGCDK